MHYIVIGTRYDRTYERDCEDNLHMAISVKADMVLHGWQAEIVEKVTK